MFVLKTKVGSRRRLENDHLPERLERHLPTQDEDLPCRLHRSPKEGWRLPLQHPFSRRREEGEIRSPGGCSARPCQALRCHVGLLPSLSPFVHILTIHDSYTPQNTFVAAFHFTIALLPAGPALITHPPVWYKPELVKTDKELEDAELKELLTKPLREDKKKAKKAKKAEEEKTAA